MSRYVNPSALKIGDRIVTNEADVIVHAVSNDWDDTTKEHLGTHVSLSGPLRYMMLSVNDNQRDRRGVLWAEDKVLTDSDAYKIYIR